MVDIKGTFFSYISNVKLSRSGKIYSINRNFSQKLFLERYEIDIIAYRTELNITSLFLLNQEDLREIHDLFPVLNVTR